jgi:hypothetical protein
MLLDLVNLVSSYICKETGRDVYFAMVLLHCAVNGDPGINVWICCIYCICV